MDLFLDDTSHSTDLQGTCLPLLWSMVTRLATCFFSFAVLAACGAFILNLKSLTLVCTISIIEIKGKKVYKLLLLTIYITDLAKFG